MRYDDNMIGNQFRIGMTLLSNKARNEWISVENFLDGSNGGGGWYTRKGS